jgi:hypothetical protein
MFVALQYTSRKRKLADAKQPMRQEPCGFVRLAQATRGREEEFWTTQMDGGHGGAGPQPADAGAVRGRRQPGERDRDNEFRRAWQAAGAE